MKHVWLDVDPISGSRPPLPWHVLKQFYKGHDDAIAILLALHSPNVVLLGISTVHGNAPSECTMHNAARCLHVFSASAPSADKPDIRVYPGAPKPLLRPTKHLKSLGADGLGGVEGLPDFDSSDVIRWFAKDADGEYIRALDGLAHAVRQTWNRGSGHQTTIVSCGPMTNVALFTAAYPDLLEAVEEIVFMGGGVGLGNRSPVAEYNIWCDRRFSHVVDASYGDFSSAHTAQMVLDAPVKKVMIPINVTHSAIVTRQMHAYLLSPTTTLEDANAPFPAPTTNLRHTLSTLIDFFADSYKAPFGFHDGPPLHDAMTVAYIAVPELFKGTRYRVDIELIGTHALGETVVDVWNHQVCGETGWGPGKKNCIGIQSVDVSGFFKFFHDCVLRCDQVSPLNLIECSEVVDPNLN
ncbi:IU-nuc-hydro domain-containing protein [Favolaschia claudopus]|uniref:IU-nuc-hydro domain-containing protein n=1 Tax=Favolaschia claudopus TaxID=2862362 RepID=A0AAW0CQM9_9AGAR